MKRLSPARLALVLGVLSAAVGVITLVALATGPSDVGWSQVAGIFLSDGSDVDAATRDIVLRVRGDQPLDGAAGIAGGEAAHEILRTDRLQHLVEEGPPPDEVEW